MTFLSSIVPTQNSRYDALAGGDFTGCQIGHIYGVFNGNVPDGTIQKVEWISEERVLIECGTAESAKIALDLVENFSMKVTNP